MSTISDNGQELFKAVRELHDWFDAASWLSKLDWLKETKKFNDKLSTEIDKEIERITKEEAS